MRWEQDEADKRAAKENDFKKSQLTALQEEAEILRLKRLAEAEAEKIRVQRAEFSNAERARLEKLDTDLKVRESEADKLLQKHLQTIKDLEAAEKERQRVRQAKEHKDKLDEDKLHQ